MNTIVIQKVVSVVLKPGSIAVMFSGSATLARYTQGYAGVSPLAPR